MDSQIDNIIIDGRFRLMILPLVKERYLRLEADIVRNGCRDPVKLWQGILVDGLNRIRICKNHKLQYQTEELVFSDRDEVIAYRSKLEYCRKPKRYRTAGFRRTIQCWKINHITNVDR